MLRAGWAVTDRHCVGSGPSGFVVVGGGFSGFETAVEPSHGRTGHFCFDVSRPVR